MVIRIINGHFLRGNLYNLILTYIPTHFYGGHSLNLCGTHSKCFIHLSAVLWNLQHIKVTRIISSYGRIIQCSFYSVLLCYCCAMCITSVFVSWFLYGVRMPGGVGAGSGVSCVEVFGSLEQWPRYK